MAKEPTVEDLINAREDGTVDLVTASAKIAGEEGGQPGMLKPSDLIEAEKGKKPDSPPPAGEPHKADGEPKPKDDEEVDLTADYENVLAKMEKGEELTPDDKVVLALFEKTVPPEQGVTYKVGEKVYTEEEALAQAVKDLGIDPAAEMSDETKAKVVKTWYKAQNRTEFSRSVQQESEMVAAGRAAVLKEHEEQERQRVELRTKAAQLDERQRQMQEQRAKLEASRTKLQELVKSKFNVEEDQVDTADPQQVYQLNRRKEILAELDELQAESDELEKSRKAVEAESVRTRVLEFVAAHPQYQTKGGDVFSVYERVEKGEQVDEEDELRVLELDLLFKEAHGLKTKPELLFKIWQKQGRIGVKGTQPPQKPAAATRSIPGLNMDKALAARLRRHIERTKGAPLPGSTAGPGALPKPAAEASDAQAIIENDRKYAGGGTGDPFVKEIGY